MTPKKQLIQLLVDKSERKTYIQYYKICNKIMEEYNTASRYFTVENYARKNVGKVYSRQQQKKII